MAFRQEKPSGVCVSLMLEQLQMNSSPSLADWRCSTLPVFTQFSVQRQEAKNSMGVGAQRCRDGLHAGVHKIILDTLP